MAKALEGEGIPHEIDEAGNLVADDGEAPAAPAKPAPVEPPVQEGLEIGDRSAEILQAAGMSFDDPDVEDWADKSFTSESQAIAALRSIVTKRSKQSNVTKAAQASAPGRASTPSHDAAALMSEYEQLRKHPMGNTKRMAEIARLLQEEERGG